MTTEWIGPKAGPTIRITSLTENHIDRVKRYLEDGKKKDATPLEILMAVRFILRTPEGGSVIEHAQKIMKFAGLETGLE